MTRTKVVRIPGQKRSPLEEKIGVERSASTGALVHITRIVNRANDQYMERVVDVKTGEVLRDVMEPLSAHRGRGDARKPSRKRGDR
jgi:hypothetical protein